MSDATTEPGQNRMTDPEVRLINDVAHALWLAASGTTLPKDVEGRKAAWNAVKKGQMQLVRGAMKRLARKGITFVRTDVAEPEAAAQADEADA